MSAPESNAPLRGTDTWETEEEATFAIASLSLPWGQRKAAEVNPGKELEGTNTATETPADAKGEASSEALSNHAPKSLLVMRMETWLLTRKSKSSGKKVKGKN